ncbi:MAG: methyltransferase [Hahellaceae bacterium]|nr:methyltransferase [Hahellaceae bacterium]MCP5169193.1 methyltransferase [Hahellaceae bacterium]
MSDSQVRTIYGMLSFKHRSKVLKQLRKTASPELHGHQIWQSCYMIMEYLEQHPPAEQTNILEIGCGWGMLGIYCAKNFNAQVTLTDADANVFPYAHAHADLNQAQVSTKHLAFSEIGESELKDKQILIGSDICFWPEIVKPLQALLTRAIQSGVKKILIADPGRHPFLRLAEYFVTEHNAKLLSWTLDNGTKNHGKILLIETGNAPA